MKDRVGSRLVFTEAVFVYSQWSSFLHPTCSLTSVEHGSNDGDESGLLIVAPYEWGDMAYYYHSANHR